MSSENFMLAVKGSIFEKFHIVSFFPRSTVSGDTRLNVIQLVREYYLTSLYSSTMTKLLRVAIASVKGC